LNRLDEILTVVTTVPAVVLSALVLRYWIPEAFRAIRRGRDAADFLVIGVAVSFFGMALATLYWAAYWTARVLNSPYQTWFLDNGDIFNVVVRQGGIIAAAWCHLKAYRMFSLREDAVDVTWHLKWTMAVTALIVLLFLLF
jgi:hypothetical protein